MLSAAVNVGAVFETIPGGGGSAYYLLSDTLSVGGTFVGGSADNLSGVVPEVDSVTVTQASMGGYIFALNARYYVTDSTFVTGGLGQRVINTLFSLDVEGDPSQQVYNDLTMSSTAVVAYLAVGNIWSFSSGMFAGAEWAGFTVPLSSSHSVSADNSAPDNPVLTAASDEAIAASEAYGSKVMFFALLVHAGWAF